MAPVPTQFGRYTLGAKVAQGGMAEIFRASYRMGEGVTKQVIIKRILPRLAADASFLRMFTTEARIAMELTHGNIAQVFDFGEVDGTWFLAMELVDGCSLARVLEAAASAGLGALPPPVAVQVVSGVLKGLHYAHTRVDGRGAPLGIVHRDVSPQNVLLSYAGEVKLVDFGIAAARIATDKTPAGFIKGKFHYFSPEQVRQETIDARTDVFAAGSVLYELLTGQLPFDGDPIEVMKKIAWGRSVPPTQLNPGLPRALEEIVARAMANSAAERYQTAAAFDQALISWLHLSAPGTSAMLLSQLMEALFARQLAAEGRSRPTSAALDAQLEQWKSQGFRPRPEPAQARSAPGETLREPTLGEPKQRRGTPRKQRLLWGAAASLFAGGLLGLAVGSGERTFDLAVTSEPPGAAVRVDGALLGARTPVSLQGLDPARPHLVQVTREGMKPWDQEAIGKGGELVQLHAELRPNEPPPPALEPPKTRAPSARAPEPPVARTATPGERPVAVDPLHHVKLVQNAAAARADLDPEATYVAWVEDRVSFGGALADVWVTECIYALEGPGVQAHQAFGVLGKKPITFRGARRIYAFVNDQSTYLHSGALRLRLKSKKGAVQTVLVDAVAHNLMPEPGERLSLRGLSVLERYRITVTARGVPAYTRAGGRGGRVVLGQEVGLIASSTEPLERRPYRVLEAGQSAELSGASQAWIWFPDVDLEDNGGALAVEVTRLGLDTLGPSLGTAPR